MPPAASPAKRAASPAPVPPPRRARSSELNRRSRTPLPTSKRVRLSPEPATPPARRAVTPPTVSRKKPEPEAVQPLKLNYDVPNKPRGRKKMIYDGDDDIDFDCEAYAAESMMRLEDGLEESDFEDDGLSQRESYDVLRIRFGLPEIDKETDADLSKRCVQAAQGQRLPLARDVMRSATFAAHLIDGLAGVPPATKPKRGRSPGVRSPAQAAAASAPARTNSTKALEKMRAEKIAADAASKKKRGKAGNEETFDTTLERKRLLLDQQIHNIEVRRLTKALATLQEKCDRLEETYQVTVKDLQTQLRFMEEENKALKVRVDELLIALNLEKEQKRNVLREVAWLRAQGRSPSTHHRAGKHTGVIRACGKGSLSAKGKHMVYVMFRTGCFTQERLAYIFNITKMSISRIVNG